MEPCIVYSYLRIFSPTFVSNAIFLTAVTLLASYGVYAQTVTAPPVVKPAPRVETSVSVGAMGQLTASRIQSTATSIQTESLAPSPGVFGTFRQSFKPWLGYSVNFGYTSPTDRYTLSPPVGRSGYITGSLIPSRMYEISISYIAQKRLSSHFSLFGEAGAGTVGFAAINNGIGFARRSNTFRPAGIIGLGVDYALPHGLGVRAQYRGLFLHYPYPDDDDSAKLTTVMSQPSLSLTYTFGTHRRR